MSAAAKSECQPPATPQRGGIPDHELSPEALEELEFFRKMSKLSQEATGREIRRLIRPAE